MARNTKRRSAPVYEVHNDETKKVFDHEPGRDIIEDFLDHVRKTGKPHEWLYHLHFPPPGDAVPVILTEFTIPERLHRQVLMAPCPLCTPEHPKYWHGMLAWFEAERAVRAIGCECGHKYLADGVLEKAIARYRRVTTNRQNLEFLITNLPKVSEAQSIIKTVYQIAKDIDDVRTQMRSVISIRCAREVYNQTHDRRKLYLYDYVDRPIVGRNGDFKLDKSGNVMTRKEPVVAKEFPFYGSEALFDLRKSARATLHTAESLLEGLAVADDDEMLQKLEQWGDDGLAEPVLRIRKAWVTIEDTLQQCRDMWLFLHEENIRNLSEWGRDPRAFRHIRARYDNLGRLDIGEIGKKSRPVTVRGSIREYVPDLQPLA